MSDLASSATQSTGKVSGFASGIMAALGNNFGAAHSSLFAGLLSQVTVAQANPVKSSTAHSAMVSSTVKTFETSAQAQNLTTLKQMSGLVKKIQSLVNAHAGLATHGATKQGVGTHNTSYHDEGLAKKPAKVAADSSAPEVVATQGAVRAENSNDVAASAEATNSTDSVLLRTDGAEAIPDQDVVVDADISVMPSISDVLAQVQQLLHMLIQNMPQPVASTAALDDGVVAENTDAFMQGMMLEEDVMAGADIPADIMAQENQSPENQSLLGDALRNLMDLARKLNNETQTTQNLSMATPTLTQVEPEAAGAHTDIEAVLEHVMATLQSVANQSGLRSEPSVAAVETDTLSAFVGAFFAKRGGAAESDVADPVSDKADGTEKKVDDFFGSAASALWARHREDAADNVVRGVAFAPNEEEPSLWDARSHNTSTADSGLMQKQTTETSLGGLMPFTSSDGVKNTSPYSFASQFSTARAAAGSATGVVDQVILHVNRGAKIGQTEMVLQLQPTDLGRVNVRLEFSGDGKVQGHVTAENQTTLDMLVKDSKSLERALQDAGLRTDSGSLQFSLSQQQGNGFKQTAKNANAQGYNVGDVQDGSALSVPADETWVISPRRINMKV